MKENIKGIELIPDKNGFLFEIEDYNYILSRFATLILLVITLFIVIACFDFNIYRVANSDHRGYFLIYVMIPWSILESIKIFVYIKSNNHKKIKFFDNRIINSKNKQIYLDNFIDGYIIKLVW